jgi:hypothetical protein
MAQETDSARWDLKVWAGTIDQLVRAAGLATRRVADAAPYPSDYDRNDPTQHYDAEKNEMWRVAERARQVQIMVIEDDGFNRSMTAIDDLVHIPDDHPGRVGVIDLEIGGNGYVPSSVKIAVSRRDGLETRVCGRNRTWTAGLRHELQDLLRPSERVRPPGLMNSEVIGGVAIGAIFPLWLGFGLLFRYVTDSVLGIRLGLSLAIALLLGGSVAFLAIRLPTMELLASGQRPKYQRWRSRILAAAVALVLGVAGSLIAAAVAHENSHSTQPSRSGSQANHQSH